MAQKNFTFDFEDRSPKSIAYESDGTERLRTTTEAGGPFVFANRAAMLALAKLLVKLSMGEYKQGLHIPIEIVQALKDRHEEWISNGKPNLETAREKGCILGYQGQTVRQLNGSRQWNPADVFVVDCNDDNVILRFGNADQQPISWPLTETTLETDVQGRFTIVLHGQGR